MDYWILELFAMKKNDNLHYINIFLTLQIIMYVFF